MDEAEKNLQEKGVAMPVIYVDKGNEKVTNFYKRKHWELCPDVIPMVKKIKLVFFSIEFSGFLSILT